MFQDVIFINNLTFDTIIGVLPHERIVKQPIIINLEVTVNTYIAACSQTLADTLDYADLASAITSLTQQAECLLVETLAQKIADLTLSYSGASSVKVSVTKPDALANASGVGVKIVRSIS